MATSSRPAGSTRAAATNSGRPAGSSWVMVRYVVPQAMGARSVKGTVREFVFMIIILMFR